MDLPESSELPVWGSRDTSSDLTARARIGNAALTQFARHGYAGTSLRRVADAAGVSVGLVQHHFGTKDGLRAACDRYVTEYLHGAAATGLDERAVADADFLSAAYRDGPPMLDYLGRALVDGSPGAAALFDDLVTLAERYVGTPAGEDGQPATSARTVAAVLTAMKLGVPILYDHLARVLDLGDDGWHQLSKAILFVVSPDAAGGDISELAGKGLRDYDSTQEERP